MYERLRSLFNAGLPGFYRRGFSEATLEKKLSHETRHVARDGLTSWCRRRPRADPRRSAAEGPAPVPSGSPERPQRWSAATKRPAATGGSDDVRRHQGKDALMQVEAPTENHTETRATRYTCRTQDTR